jgi:hypothetical protein
MKKPIYKFIFILLLLSFSTGCSITSKGFGFGPFWYSDPGPSSGYQGTPSGLPLGTLGCKITYPPSYTKAKWDQTIWIYGVVWREGMNVDAYPWEGPEWAVDFGKIGSGYYFYDELIPEIWVRFPFDGRTIGPGQHQITLTAWDNRDGGSFMVQDSIILLVE